MEVSRTHSAGAQQAAGLVGALVFAAFAPFTCKACGKISRAEFAAEHRATMTRNSVLLGVGALALLAACVAALAALNR